MLVTLKRNSFVKNENYSENVPLNVPLSEREKIILALIVQNNEITTKEIATKLNTNEKTIKRDFANLKEKNIIKREGSKKAGYWEICI